MMFSMVVKRLTDKKLVIYSKGADSSILPKIHQFRANEE